MTDKYDRHIFLYAKSWYKSADVIEDMKIILAERSGLDYPKCISESDIIIVLSHIVTEFIDFEGFINKLMDNQRFSDFAGNKPTRNELLIETMLSVLAFTNVEDIPFKLGEPDSKILPLWREKDDTYR